MDVTRTADAGMLLDRISGRARAFADEIDALVEELRTADREWISVRRAADLLDVSPTTVYIKIKDGELLCRTFGGKKLVRWSDIARIIDGRGDRFDARRIPNGKA